jgi:hypothetical protein
MAFEPRTEGPQLTDVNVVTPDVSGREIDPEVPEAEIELPSASETWTLVI